MTHQPSQDQDLRTALGPDHEFKSHPDVFWPAVRGEKMFEFRKNDRGGYSVGQTVRLRCYDPDHGYLEHPALDRRITNVLRGGEFGLQEGYCVLSLAALTPSAPIAAPGRDDGALPAGLVEPLKELMSGYYSLETMLAHMNADVPDNQPVKVKAGNRTHEIALYSDFRNLALALASLPAPAGDVPGEAQTQTPALFERLEKILQEQDAAAPPLGREETVACGGCGATQSSQRCLGCFHDFGGEAQTQEGGR
jgi:hypothetical protein